MSREAYIGERIISPAIEAAKEVAANTADAAQSFFLKTFEGVREANDDDNLYWGEKDYKGERMEQAVQKRGIIEGSLVEIALTVDGKATKLTGTVLRSGSDSITIRTIPPNEDTMMIAASQILRGKRDHQMRVRKLSGLSEKERAQAVKAKVRLDARIGREENPSRVRKAVKAKAKKFSEWLDAA